jgi:hypothetical protein
VPITIGKTDSTSGTILRRCRNASKDCPLQSVCGGGFLGNRYSKDNGFDYPSIYSKEIIEIICHIQNEV